jgi:hypothetical protein
MAVSGVFQARSCLTLREATLSAKCYPAPGPNPDGSNRLTLIRPVGILDYVLDLTDSSYGLYRDIPTYFIAEMDLANLLGIDYGTPLFFVENIYYSIQNQPVVVTHMYYRGDFYTYRASISLPEVPLPRNARLPF